MLSKQFTFVLALVLAAFAAIAMGRGKLRMTAAKKFTTGEHIYV